MKSSVSLVSECVVVEAALQDVEKAYNDLNRDMKPAFVHVFLDKIERYARKPDRALFLVKYRRSFIAFATIIESAPVPEELSREFSAPLIGYACGTGLMVLPEFRKQGVASLLVRQWDHWSREQGLPGIWVVTKNMGSWYRDHFGYMEVGQIFRKGVEKTVLQKQF